MESFLLEPKAVRPGGTRRRVLLDLFPAEGSLPPPAVPRPTPGPLRALSPSRPGLSEVLVPRLDELVTYETFYGLNEKPFSLSSDPKFLYHSTAHDDVAQQLLSAIRNRDAIVVVTGAPGTGKTTLCRAVMDQLDRRTLTSFVPDPFVSIDELLKTALLDFGVISRSDLDHGRLARASRHDLTTALREFLVSLAPLQAFAVVLIDEAQNLPLQALEEIRLLSDGEADQRLLQVVLIGQPALLHALERTEARQIAARATVRCRLEPLAKDEVGDYVMHRLAVAGTNARVEFGGNAFARLHGLSAGIPRVINILCDRALTFGYDASASVIDGALIDRAAEDLDIEPIEPRAARFVRLLAAVAAFVFLMLVGAGAAALVFHDRLAQVIARWESIPAPPSRPLSLQPAALTPPPAANWAPPPASSR